MERVLLQPYYQGKIPYEVEKIGYAKTSTCTVDFPLGNWLYSNISGGKFYYIAVSDGKFYYGKISHFSAGKYQGGGGGRSYSLTEPIHIPKGSIKGYWKYKEYKVIDMFKDGQTDGL